MRITEAAKLIVKASREEEQAAQRGVGLDERERGGGRGCFGFGFYFIVLNLLLSV